MSSWRVGTIASCLLWGCGEDSRKSRPAPDQGPPPDSRIEDAGVDVAPDMPPPPRPNIGEWCDPTESDNDGENPACINGARCLELDDPPANGMCVVMSCQPDEMGTAGIDEDNCKTRFGEGFVCVNRWGSLSGSPYDPPFPPPEPDPRWHACVPICTPSATENPCEPEFSCTADSTRFNFKDAVCLNLACQDGRDCPVTVAADDSCVTDVDCGPGEFCAWIRDYDGDGEPDVGNCAVEGNCRPNGTCGLHSLGGGAPVGAPCQADIDCSSGGTCLTEQAVDDNLGVTRRMPRNGYCSILGCRFPEAYLRCPRGNACNHSFFPGACMDLCDPSDPSGCRQDSVRCDVAGGVVDDCDWYGDYDCWNWEGWSFNVNQLPVVDGGDGRICDYVGLSLHACGDFAWGCQSVASPGSLTDMDCRDPETGLPTPTNDDPAGRCLDTTGSGDFCANLGGFDEDGDCVP